jgi:hypothetical protein
MLSVVKAYNLNSDHGRKKVFETSGTKFTNFFSSQLNNEANKLEYYIKLV